MSSGRINAYLLRSTIVAALGGLLFRFDTIVIAGATSALITEYSLSPTMPGFTVAAALWVPSSDRCSPVRQAIVTAAEAAFKLSQS